MRYLFSICLLLIWVPLSGCFSTYKANTDIEYLPENQLSHLTGKPESAIISQLGEPMVKVCTEDKYFLIYESSTNYREGIVALPMPLTVPVGEAYNQMYLCNFLGFDNNKIFVNNSFKTVFDSGTVSSC